MSKGYRLKVKKIPLKSPIPIFQPNFPPLENLHLDMLENKEKLKKNAPKPVFVRETINNVPSSRNEFRDSESEISDNEEDDFVFDDLINRYGNPDTDNETNSTNGTVSEDESEVFKDFGSSVSVQPPAPAPVPAYSEPESAPSVRTTYTIPEQESESEDSEEREKEEKADYLFKFMVLRRQYPNVEIQEFTEHSDLGTMKRVYNQIIRRVSLDSNVESYKQWLVGGFMIMEFMSVNWFGIDLQGFTQQQIRMSNKYDRLLLELGEKNYSPKGSRFPVEVRLIFMIFMNAGLFFVQKSVLSGSGGDVLAQFLGGNSNNNSGSGSRPNFPRASPTRPRVSRMRGPTISPEEVENLARQAESSSEF